MRAEIIKIGNSKGLRIPKAILEHCGLTDVVNLKVDGHTLIITSSQKTRAGWGKDFQRMAKNKDDQLLDTDSMVHFWDEDEWQW